MNFRSACRPSLKRILSDSAVPSPWTEPSAKSLIDRFFVQWMLFYTFPPVLIPCSSLFPSSSSPLLHRLHFPSYTIPTDLGRTLQPHFFRPKNGYRYFPFPTPLPGSCFRLMCPFQVPVCLPCGLLKRIFLLFRQSLPFITSLHFSFSPLFPSSSITLPSLSHFAFGDLTIVPSLLSVFNLNTAFSPFSTHHNPSAQRPFPPVKLSPFSPPIFFSLVSFFPQTVCLPSPPPFFLLIWQHRALP